MFLVCIIFMVALFGIVYYYQGTQKESMSGKGVLISSDYMGWRSLWQE